MKPERMQNINCRMQIVKTMKKKIKYILFFLSPLHFICNQFVPSDIISMLVLLATVVPPVRANGT